MFATCDWRVASPQTNVKRAVAIIGTHSAISCPRVSANKINAKFALLANNEIAIPAIWKEMARNKPSRLGSVLLFNFHYFFLIFFVFMILTISGNCRYTRQNKKRTKATKSWNYFSGKSIDQFGHPRASYEYSFLTPSLSWVEFFMWCFFTRITTIFFVFTTRGENNLATWLWAKLKEMLTSPHTG